MQVVILAGGKGTRLSPLTDNLPKALVPVLGEPFAFRQLRWLQSQGITDVVYCTGHLGHMIEEAVGKDYAGLRIRYSQEPEPLHHLGAIRHALPLLEQWFFTLYCDSYLPELDILDMAQEFCRNRPRTLMACYSGVDYGITAYDRSTFEHDEYPVFQPWHEMGSWSGISELERFLTVAQ